MLRLAAAVEGVVQRLGGYSRVKRLIEVRTTGA